MLQTTAIGYLGNDAVLKTVNEKSVINFSIAHTEKYKNKDGTTVEKTTWVECSMWDAENVAKYLQKGTQVYIQGTPESRAYTSKEGELKSTLHVRVQNLQLLGSATNKNENAAEATVNTTVKKAALASADMLVDDDLPF